MKGCAIMQDPFNIIMIIMYFIFILLIGFQYLKRKNPNISHDKEYRINERNDSVLGIPLNLIRNQYFPYDKLPDRDFYITSFMQEVFNIFLKLSPNMISTLSKVERRMVGLKVAIDNPISNDEHIKSEIEYLDNILDEMVKVSHSMIEKLEEHILDDQPNQVKVYLSKDMVQLYMNAVNLLMDLTDNHAMLNYEIHGKLVNSYPDLVEPFRIISGKVTYLFFINLISYSNKIDENLYLSDE